MNETTNSRPSPLLPRPLLLAGGTLVAAVIGLLIWQALKPGASGGALGRLEGDMHALMFTSDGRVLYGQHGGIQTSSDGGKTWSDPGGQGDAMGLGASGETMYLAGHDVFQKSTDGGKTWTSPGFGNLPATDIHGFAVGPGRVRSRDGEGDNDACDRFRRGSFACEFRSLRRSGIDGRARV